MSDKNNVMESISAFLKENSRDAKQAIHRLQNLNHSLIKSYADKSLKLQEEFNRSKKSAEDILKAAQTKINSDKNLKETEKQRLNDKAAERCRLQIAAAQKIYDKQLQEYLSVKVKEILKTVKEEYASIQINEADLQGFASILETQIQAATSASMVRSLSEVLKRAESNIGGPANVSGILKEMQTKMASSVGKFSSYTLELEKLAKIDNGNAGVRQALENISDSQDKMQKEMNNVNIEIEQHLEATRKAEENIQNFFMRHKGDWDRLSKEDIAEQQRLLGVIDDLKDKQEALHAKQKETYIKISKLAKDALKNKGNVVSSLAEKVKEIDADIKSVESEFNAGKKQYAAQKEDLHRLEKSLIGKRLSTGMDTSEDKVWDAANKSIKFVSGGDQARKASSEKWLKARVDEDKAMGRLIKGFYSAKIGWQRKKGIAKIGGLVTGIGGSIASDIHGSVRKWKTSGGLGKFLVGSALDWGMTKIKKGIDYRSMSKLSQEASKLKENYLTLLQKNATADAVNKAKYEYNKKIVQLYDLNMNAATLGRHFLGQKHSGIFDEGKEAKEADAIRKEIAEYEKEFKGKTASVSGGNLLSRFATTGKNWIGRAKSLAANGRSYGRRLASIGIPMRPQMAPEPIPMAEGGVVARIGEGKHSEAVIPLAGRGAKMVGEAIGQKVGQAAGKKGMQYKSSQQMEEEQKAAENQANIASNVATIVRLLEEQNKLAKQKKPESLLSKILGFLGMMATALLPKILKFIKFAWKGIRLVGKILKPVIRILSKLGGPLLKLLGMLGKGLFGILGKLGKGAGALLSGAKEGAAKLGEKVKDFTGKGKGGKAPKTRRLGLGRDVGNAGKAAGKGGLKSAGKMLGRLAGPLTAALAAYDAYEAWNDEDLHKRAFGLKDGEKASTGQKIQAGMAGAGAGILNIGSGAVGLLGAGARKLGETFGINLDGVADSLDSVAKFIEFDPATLIKAYNAPLKTIGGKLLELTDGIPVLGDAVKGIGDFIESSPMLKGAVNWLDEHNPLKAITEGVGKTIDWFNSDTKWEDLKSGFKAVGSAITDTCCNVGSWFSEKAQNIGSWIGEKASGAWEGVKSGFSAADEWVGEKAESAWNFIKENNPIAVTQQGFEKAKDFFDKNAPAAWNFIKENNPIALAKKGFEGVKGFFAEKFGNISNWLSGGNNPFQPIFNFLNSIGEFFKGLTLSGLAQKTGLVPDFLVSWLQEKGLAQGGLVKASRGGTLAVIGEGGEDEAVLPLSKLAQIIYESFKIHDALVTKRSSALGEVSKSIGNASALTGIFGNAAGSEEPRAGWAIDLLEEIKKIGKNIDLMTKMIKLIKVDGVTLGELVENKMLAMGGGVSGAAAQAAQAAQQAAGMANPASPSYGGGGGQTPMYPAQSGGQGGGVYGAAPFVGGQKAGGVSGKYGAITGMRDELVLPLSQRAKGANGKPMEWSQATNNPGNVGNTDQGRTNIFPDLQSGLRAQAELLQKRYSGMTLLQMCQKYTPTKWQTAIKTWTTSGIKENEVPNLGDPGTMARLLKAIHKAEGSSKWVPEEEVDYALGLRQMPEGYQKKDYRQLTEKGRALVGKPDQSTPPPQTPGAAGTQAPNPAAGAAAGAAPSIVPQAKFMPAANGDPYKQTLVPQMPAQQPVAQQSPEASFRGSVNNILQIAQKNASISGKHGYSKKNRLGSNQFDCSSFVGRSLQEAGYNVGPISDFTTPKMPAKLGPKGLKFPWTSGLQGIQPGDIAWRNGHTEISIGNGKTIGALNSDAGVGVHPLSWGKYTGYWRPTGAVSGGDQQGQEQQGQSASPQGASPLPQMQPVQPAAGQAPSFVPRPSAPPAGMQPMANPSPAIGGLQKPIPVDNYQPPAQSPSGGAAAPMLNLPKSNLPLERRETLSAKKQQIANLVIAEAKRQGVDPRLALALANQESRFDQNDVSHAGAVGVMQLMKCDVAAYGGGDRYNVNDNIRMGVTQLKKKLDLAHGDVREALLRYNWGDGNFNKWKKGLRTDMPKEASQYADRVLGHIDNGTVEGIMKAAGEPAASGGINPYAPQQQGNPVIPGLTAGPPVQGMPPQQGPAIPGLSGVYAAMTANAMQRGVKYKLGARNSMTGRVDCSGWTIEMQKQVMQGVQDPEARARLGHVLAGGTAEGIIARGLKFQGGQSASLDPSQIKEGTMIGIKARKGGWGSDRAMGIGHIVTTFRDPNTGRMMVSESTSRGSAGRSGVITTDYEQWYKQHAGRTMWGVDTGALIGGQFDAGNVKAQMEAGGAQQTQYGMGATPQSGPQIQASQQGMVNEQAAAYYAQGGGGGNIDASTNINGMPGGGGKKPSVEMVLNKDPMGWIVLQGNAVH